MRPDYGTIVGMLRELGFRASWCEVNAWTEEQRDDIVVALDGLLEKRRAQLPWFVQRHRINVPLDLKSDGSEIVGTIRLSGHFAAKYDAEPGTITAKWSAVCQMEEALDKAGREPIAIRTSVKGTGRSTVMEIRIDSRPKQ